VSWRHDCGACDKPVLITESHECRRKADGSGWEVLHFRCAYPLPAPSGGAIVPAVQLTRSLPRIPSP
jgi:hypothetical protein